MTKKKKVIVAVRQDGKFLYTSGHGPENQLTGRPIYQGRVGGELTLEEGYLAARAVGAIDRESLEQGLAMIAD